MSHPPTVWPLAVYLYHALSLCRDIEIMSCGHVA